MRTTLTIDDDILIAAKTIAQQQDRSLGEVISNLARRALLRPKPDGSRNGIPLLSPKPGAGPVTLDMVNALRDEARVTDTYLPALARAHRGHLATSDRKLSTAAVRHGKAALTRFRVIKRVKTYASRTIVRPTAALSGSK